MGLQRRYADAGLMLDGILIGARQQPLIVERVDPSIQSAGRPALAGGFLVYQSRPCSSSTLRVVR